MLSSALLSQNALPNIEDQRLRVLGRIFTSHGVHEEVGADVLHEALCD